MKAYLIMTFVMSLWVWLEQGAELGQFTFISFALGGLVWFVLKNN